MTSSLPQRSFAPLGLESRCLGLCRLLASGLLQRGLLADGRLAGSLLAFDFQLGDFCARGFLTRGFSLHLVALRRVSLSRRLSRGLSTCRLLTLGFYSGRFDACRFLPGSVLLLFPRTHGQLTRGLSLLSFQLCGLDARRFLPARLTLASSVRRVA